MFYNFSSLSFLIYSYLIFSCSFSRYSWTFGIEFIIFSTYFSPLSRYYLAALYYPNRNSYLFPDYEKRALFSPDIYFDSNFFSQAISRSRSRIAVEVLPTLLFGKRLKNYLLFFWRFYNSCSFLFRTFYFHRGSAQCRSFKNLSFTSARFYFA